MQVIKLLLHSIVLFCGTIYSVAVYKLFVDVAGKSAMVEGPGILDKEASAAYHNLSHPGKEQLRHQVEQVTSEKKRMTKKDVIRRGEKIFVKIQKLVHKITMNNVHEYM